MRQEGNDPIILDAGDLFFTTPDLHDSNRVSEKYRASVILMGYEQIGCDAINVGQYEFGGGEQFLLETASTTQIPFISANLINTQTNQLLFNPYIIIEREGLKIAVIGLTNLLPKTIKNIRADDYITAGKSMIKKVKDNVDIIVMLVNANRADQKKLTKEFKEANLIFTSGSTALTRPMMNQPEKGPYLFSTGRESRYLNVTDISLKNKTDPIINISFLEASQQYNQRKLDRLQDTAPNKTLEDTYEGQENILSLIEKSRTTIIQADVQLKEAVNTLIFKNVALDSKIIDDQEVLEFVSKSLATCNQLKN
jgi:2',3'-cyclic-nucleotide 2'-phosphodiesterase (5'-nucleotidase family)